MNQERPTPPSDYECCENGCNTCVWDVYFEQLKVWKAAQETPGDGQQNLRTDTGLPREKLLTENTDMTNPPVIYRTRIKPEWLDYNNHMNVAYYVLIFDEAGVEMVANLGLSEAVTEQTHISWMVLENHITYNNEVVLDQPVEVTCQLIDHDAKRLHLYFEMHAEAGDGSTYLASTLEQMAMCVNLETRRSAEFPADVASAIDAMAEQQKACPRPENIGRTIGIRRR